MNPVQQPVAVVGATGTTGRRVVAALRRRGAPVVAISRHPDPPGTDDGVLPRRGDLRDPASVRAALAGTGAAYLIPPTFQPDETRLLTDTMLACRDAGATRVVLHSVLHPHTTTMPHHLRKADAEDALRRTGLAWTILQPSMYAQTVSRTLIAGASGGGDVPVPWDPASLFSPVHLGDVTEVAALVLTEDGHEHASYELAGPQALSTATMITTVGDVTGRDLRARAVARWDVLPYPAGTSQADTLLAMCGEYTAYGLLGNSRVLAMLLGREPTSFVNACRADLAVR